MKCWICGKENATTREHRIKASDLRSLFGAPTQASPLYFHTDKRRNKKVGSLKADILKYQHLICLECNSARTQPHDQAWQYFSEMLRSRLPPLQVGDTFRLNRIFPYDTRRLMRNVHLYFVKLFGCQIVEGAIPIDISSFAQAIIEGRPHPKLYFVLGRLPDMGFHVGGGSDVHAALLDGKVAFASWLYQVNDLCVNVMYAEEWEQRQGLEHAWHPRSAEKRLLFKKFGN